MTICGGIYKGDLVIESRHELSNTLLLTDAPVDNQGKGLSFSPTDLVGVALGTCILTTMGIVANRHSIDLSGAKYSVEKTMTTGTPRKIDTLKLQFDLPASLTEEMKSRLERTVSTCPVHHSLSSDVKVLVTFNYII